MPKEPPTILAINPGTRYLGFAAFRGPELLDWGVRVIRAKTSRGTLRVAATILNEAIDRFQPDTLAIKQLHRSRSSASLNSLTGTMKKLCRRRKLHVCQYSIGQLKQALCPEEPANKRRLAEHVVAAYPVLTHELQREQANLNPYYIRVFEAVALGMICYEALERKSQNH